MSTGVYDTAWVAMIEKTVGNKKEFLFPECFQSLLESQLPDGSWQRYASDVDGILNTSAALLAFKKHMRVRDLQSDDLASRCSKAEKSLQAILGKWDVGSTDHVGFEILVPGLLRLLEAERIFFEFPGRKLLMDLNAAKLARFNINILYKPIPITLVHSLEAFVGTLNFDKVLHHKVNGAMMGSPSSTAAYLMNCSVWDDEAEMYLRTVLNSTQGTDGRSLPCAFPTTVFELSWVITTLLGGGFSISELDSSQLSVIADCLEQSLKAHGGIVGFASSCLPDADDTAKTIMALHLLRRSASVTPMIKEFEGQSHFITYKGERNASFSANCNVLTCLLHLPDPSAYSPQIVKATKYLICSWRSGKLKDKWNLSPQYSMMLLAQGLVQLLSCWQEDKIADIPEDLLNYQIPLVSFQILLQTMQRQQPDGSWESMHEVTAYAVLTLTYLSSLPWIQAMAADVASAIEQGKEYLHQTRQLWTRGNYLWVEKVTYSSTNLSQAYCIAAIKATAFSRYWGSEVQRLSDVPLKAVTKFVKFFAMVPMFSEELAWKLRAAMIEGYLFLPELKRVRSNIFPPQKSLKEDKYVEYLAFTWTAPNTLNGSFLNTDIMSDMIILSLLIFQIDEYMELVIIENFGHNLEPIKEMVRRHCEAFSGCLPHTSVNGTSLFTGNVNVSPTSSAAHLSTSLTPPGSPKNGTSPHTLSSVSSVLAKFISWVLQNPKVVTSTPNLQRQLAKETEGYILAHLHQLEDNTRFWQQPDIPIDRTTTFATPRSTYFSWVRNIGANHIACPYSFEFFSCLISGAPNIDPFPGARAKYLANDLCRHLACLCRQYNDAASIPRDRLEHNLNSVNFPEFSEHYPVGEEESLEDREARMKRDLLWVAEYERECYTTAMKHLEKEREVKEDTMKAVRVFVDVTDLYGQMYLAKDITTRIRGEGYQREENKAEEAAKTEVKTIEMAQEVTQVPGKVQKLEGLVRKDSGVIIDGEFSILEVQAVA